MAPGTNMAALLQSPSNSDSTVILGGKTLPDITLGSLGSSFRSDEDDEGNMPHNIGNAGPSKLAGRPRGLRSPEPSSSASSAIATPSPLPPPASALLSLSPPTTVRRPSSYSSLPEPGSHAPKRNRVLRKHSVSSVSSSDDTAALDARYGAGGDMGSETDEDPAGVLTSLSINISPKKSGRAGQAGGNKRNARHRVAASDAASGPMTLREQEQELDAVKKDNFNLQLENHFLKERLANMAPDHIEAALKENVKLKLEILNLSKEMKKLKKLLLQQDRDLAEAARAGSSRGGGQDARELERLYKEEKERRKAAEAEAKRLDDEAQAVEQEWKQRCEALEDELESAKVATEDANEALDKARDEADRALDQLDTLKSEMADLERSREGRPDKGEDGRLQRQIEELEQENAGLRADLEGLEKKARTGLSDDAQATVDRLQDKLAATQLELDNRDGEIEELNNELDAKARDHEAEIAHVEAEWRAEVVETRAQVDELKDALEARDADVKEIREILSEKEELLAITSERVAELQAAQNETHDRLEDTMRNIELDQADKEADLIAANREVEELGQRVFELEEMIEEMRAREADLTADLRSADEAFETSKTHYESLVTALKEARRKLQSEKEEVGVALREEEAARLKDRERWRKERADEADKWRQAMDEQDKEHSKLMSELEAQKRLASQKERDLASAQAALRALEDERRKLGDEHTSDRFSLELELDHARRDLARAEDDLEDARDQIRKREAEIDVLRQKQRDLENELAAERQSRLNMSDKLDAAKKSSSKYEREASMLRERMEELEPLLTETQQEQFRLQKASEQQRQERSELLLRVFKDVNRFLGTEDHTTPANFAVFKDTLLSRLRTMTNMRSDFEKRVKETETGVEHKMSGLRRQLESKWRALDNFEASVKKLEVTRAEWRRKYAAKDGELEAAKARIAELNQQNRAASRSGGPGGSGESSSQIRSLTERASAAEKRAANAANQLAMLESRISEMQDKAAKAERKWEARVQEYESRLRIAGEKIKTEKQGGKERALQLEAQVRDLERQVQDARRRNVRAEGVVASAQHLLEDD